MAVQQFTYKPALVLKRVQASVDGLGVTLTRGNKSRRVAFAEVTGVRLVELVGRTSSTSLVLLTAGGKMTLHCGVQSADAVHDANARAFVSACAAVLTALGRARPDMQVSYGGGVGLRTVMAGLGVAMAVVGVFTGVMAFVGSGLGDKIWFGVLAAVMVYGGARMAWSFNPFRAPPTEPAADAARNFALLAMG
ncbi:MAG: hypothetical protein Q8R02_16690 [Hyphomonadaceae bacterium]|nr:hypothetical protein [Hyphomonadaceae bacterium]